MVRIGDGDDEGVRADLEIEDGHITIQADGEANLYVDTPDETPLTAYGNHATLRVTAPWSAHADDHSYNYSAEIQLDAGALEALLGALPDQYQPTASTDSGRPQLHVGDQVQDREGDDERTMLVVGTPPKRADEYVVDGDGDLEATVADYNEDYPTDDLAVEVKYPQRTATDIESGQRYAFPRSRLELSEPIHDIEGDS